MNHSGDAVVVGGGVIGTSIAYYLSKKGVKVTLLERGRVGGQASNVAAGALSPPLARDLDPYSRMALLSLAMFPELSYELYENSGIDIEFSRCGELSLALTQSDADYFHDLQNSNNEGHIEWIDTLGLKEYQQGISSTVLGALYESNGGKVNNQRLSEAYAKAAVNLGADIRPFSEVTGLLRSGLTITGVRTVDSEFHAKYVILSAGPWTRSLAENVGSNFPMEPVKGVNLCVRPDNLLVTRVLHASWGTLVPRNDGTLIVGGTIEHMGFDDRVTASSVRDIIELMVAMLPSLESAEVNWALAGLRPNSSDDLPLIGNVVPWDGLYVATAHYRNGILLSPITGRLLSEFVLGEESELIRHFSPRRFRST